MNSYILYTPGRCGSISVQTSLKNKGITSYLFHNHRDSYSIDGILREVEATEIFNAKYLFVEKLLSSEDKNRVITLIRDPMDRAISAFTYFYSFYRPGLTPTRRKAQFIKEYPHKWYLEFFTQFQQLFPVNVLSLIKDNTERCWSMETSKSIIVVGKCPYFKELETRLKGVFGLDVQIPHMNKSKVYKDVYTELHNNKYPEELISSIYSSQLVSTLFSPQEIQEAKDKWVQ